MQITVQLCRYAGMHAVLARGTFRLCWRAGVCLFASVAHGVFLPPPRSASHEEHGLPQVCVHVPRAAAQNGAGANTARVAALRRAAQHVAAVEPLPPRSRRRQVSAHLCCARLL
jgi:hypothetical protein